MGQRVPRVRFGKVDVYNNLYEIPTAAAYTYSWGVGVEARLFAENNLVRLGAGVTPDKFIRVFAGKSMRATGTVVDDGTRRVVVDMLAAYNAANDPKLADDAGWTPSLRMAVDKAEDAANLVSQRAGPGS